VCVTHTVVVPLIALSGSLLTQSFLSGEISPTPLVSVEDCQAVKNLCFQPPKMGRLSPPLGVPQVPPPLGGNSKPLNFFGTASPQGKNSFTRFCNPAVPTRMRPMNPKVPIRANKTFPHLGPCQIWSIYISSLKH